MKLNPVKPAETLHVLFQRGKKKYPGKQVPSLPLEPDGKQASNHGYFIFSQKTIENFVSSFQRSPRAAAVG